MAKRFLLHFINARWLFKSFRPCNDAWRNFTVQFFTLWGEVEPVNPLNTSLPFGLTHDMEIKFVNEEKTKII